MHTTEEASGTVRHRRADALALMGYAALILFFELAFIRYTAGYVRIFGFYLNFVLIATFLGMGTGLLLAERAARLRWLALPLALLPFLAVWLLTRTVIAVPNDPDEFLWHPQRGLETGVPLWLVVATLFVLLAAFFVPLGSLLGQRFRRLPPLRAYAFDLGGSIAGIVTFGALSALGLPPIVWFALGFAAWVALSLDSRRFAAAIAAVGAVALALCIATRQGPTEVWSPYYRIETTRDGRAVALKVNGALHQVILDLDSARAAAVPYASVVRAGYLLPYRYLDDVDTALVVGAGTGNDVALLLTQDVDYVDAVEIDPVIARLGRELHPQRPYDDPRVNVHIDDARAFLRRTDRRYDLIIFGTLDSQTLLSGMSSVRLDNYVYTVESFESARSRLAPGGALVVYHRSAEPYIAAKIHQMMGDAFGGAPAVLAGEMYLFNFIFMAGDDAARVPPPSMEIQSDLSVAYARAVDDWPYLYLRAPTIPGHYRLALLLVLATAAVFVFVGGGRAARRRPDAAMFFMGAGFLLVETKSVTEMSLLFGSTWTVNLLVFSSILVMVLAANLWVLSRPPLRLGLLFVGLLGSLVLAWAIPASRLLWLGGVGQWLVAGLLVAAPILFAALIFSTLFREVDDAARALAWNLIGAIVGGVLEYASMAIGIKGLYGLAALIYVLAWMAVTRSRAGARRDPGEAGAREPAFDA